MKAHAESDGHGPGCSRAANRRPGARRGRKIRNQTQHRDGRGNENQKSLGVDVSAGQATVAIFYAGLALSQLAWGESLNRIGPRRCLLIGVSALIVTSVGCALATSLSSLLALRFIQGLAAGAATIVAPSVVRSTLAGRDAVRGIAAISMVEALVPAAGPVLGAALLVYLSWRGTFWILAGAALVVLPIVARITPWCGFCCFLAVRGPPAISDALHLPTAQMGRASAVMVLAFLIAAALGTQLIAPLLDRPSVLPMAVGMLLFTVGSAALITPYPERVAAHDPPGAS